MGFSVRISHRKHGKLRVIVMSKMLTKTLFLTVSLAAAGLFAPTMRADELFSRESTGSVFRESNRIDATQGRPQAVEQGRKIGSAAQLSDILRDSGLEPEAEGERIVNVKLQHAKWTFPIAMGINEAGDQIRLAMTLSQFEAGKQPTSNQLLALLGANREHQPAFFSFSEKRRQIELFLSISNEQVTARLLREELRRAATIAESTASLWDINSSPPVAKTPTIAKPAQPQTAPATSSGLIGKWSAARSNTQAFALQFKADGSFMLVSVINGKQTKANGKFNLNATQLTLTTDKGTSTAAVTNISANSFEFTPPGKAGAKLTFKRAS
jgi:uncharacterized protein (TIGR03066 family)